jgi:superfamily II DNA helicase RecQ
MSNFFKHAPARETDQNRFLEAVTNRQNVIASFPLGYPVVALYAFAAMLGGGLVVAVCPSARHIRRNLDYFKSAGFKFPDVAYLDGTQMPHEERAVEKEINHNRVRLLYTTPERFTSLTFLDILVHADVHFMLIEEADRFLPVTLGHSHYQRFQEEGLGQLRKLPPLALMTPPLPPRRCQELSARLNLSGYQSIQCPPLMEPVELRVQCFMTEHQKFSHMVDVLSGSPGAGKQGRLDGPGAVLIQTAYPAQAEKLGATLMDYGFDAVWITHFKKNGSEQARVLEIANTRLNAIVVNAGSDMRSWQPPDEARPRVIFWTPPTSVEDLFMQVFRQGQASPSAYGEAHFMKALVLYTKEDFQAALKRVQTSRALGDGEAREKISALRHYRRWVLSDPCRLQSLVANFQGASTIEMAPCGKCDRCQERRRSTNRRQSNLIQRLIQRWFF